MLELAVAGHERFKVDRRELRKAVPSFTVETLAELQLGQELSTDCVRVRTAADFVVEQSNRLDGEILHYLVSEIFRQLERETFGIDIRIEGV